MGGGRVVMVMMDGEVQRREEEGKEGKESEGDEAGVGGGRLAFAAAEPGQATPGQDRTAWLRLFLPRDWNRNGRRSGCAVKSGRQGARWVSQAAALACGSLGDEADPPPARAQPVRAPRHFAASLRLSRAAPAQPRGAEGGAGQLALEATGETVAPTLIDRWSKSGPGHLPHDTRWHDTRQQSPNSQLSELSITIPA